MPEEPAIQTFWNVLKKFHERELNRRQLREKLLPVLLRMHPEEVEATLASFFQDPQHERFMDIRRDVAEVITASTHPNLLPALKRLHATTQDSFLATSYARALVKHGEPAAPAFHVALGGDHSQKYSAIKALHDADFKQFSEESQAALLKKVAAIAFSKKEDALTRKQAFETLHEVATKGAVEPLAAVEVLGSVAKNISSKKVVLNADSIDYVNYMAKALVDHVTSAVKTISKKKGAAKQAALEKTEDALHDMLNQTLSPQLQEIGLRGLADLGRATPRTANALLEAVKDEKGRHVASELLVKIAPSAGETNPGLVRIISEKFVQEKDPLLAASYGKFLALAGTPGVKQLSEIMSTHENEATARHAAQWLAQAEEGAKKLARIASTRRESALVRARAAYGLGATSPFLARRLGEAHLTILHRLASSPSENHLVRQAALEGLLSSGGRGVEKIRKMIDAAPTPKEKLAMTTWLTQASSGLNALAEILSTHGDATTRAAAALAVENSATTLAAILPQTKEKTLHPLYTALKKAAAQDENEEVRTAAALALKRLRAVRHRKTFAPLFARTSSVLPPAPASATQEAKPRIPTEKRTTRKQSD